MLRMHTLDDGLLLGICLILVIPFYVGMWIVKMKELFAAGEFALVCVCLDC